MPAHEEHVAAAVSLLGGPREFYDKIYKWQDAPYDTLGIFHRIYHHDVVKTPVEAERLFGPGAGDAVKLHILMDQIQDVNIFQSIGWVAGLVALGVGTILFYDRQSVTP